MTAHNVTLQINRSSHGEPRVEEADLPELGAGQVRLRIERFALTANTVTYATVGDTIGYWDFFPTGVAGWGNVPAMGWAEVVESRNPDIAAGGRYYGWYPMSRYVDMMAVATADGLRDDGAHRAAHAPIYRAYTATERDAFYEAGADAENRHALLRGLFLTGWLADDFFADNGWFGARRVLVLSASSKTAIGFAHCADARSGLEVIGVTSPRNHSFTHALGHYDVVVSYAEVARVPRDTPVVSIDMAGNGLVLADVHTHFGDQLKHSMAVGYSHHDAPARAAALSGPQPQFFFAPTQVKKRVQEWGPRGYQQRVATALHEFVAASRRWLQVQPVRGATNAAQTWRDVHAGQVPAHTGYVVSLWD